MSDLTKLNSFGIAADSSSLHVINSVEELQALIQSEPQSWFILGGGSNILFLDEAPEHIVLMNNLGIEYQEQGDSILVTAQAGVVWHELIQATLAKGYSGLENMALIPGKVGAAPIQNIGAYGVELQDRFESLKAMDMETAEVVDFNKEQCLFGYRDSFFKTEEGRKYCILEVTLKLDKVFELVMGHQGLLSITENPEAITAQQVFDMVCDIRRSKLPDPELLGNAGSFFKNPVIDGEQYRKLLAVAPSVVAYPQFGKRWKLAAAWLIDNAGLKGYRDGNVGVHEKQALVLVNHGGATGKAVANLAKYVQSQVFDKYGVLLEPEVTLLSQSGPVKLGDI